mgnify:CR=1 FL=1
MNKVAKFDHPLTLWIVAMGWTVIAGRSTMIGGVVGSKTVPDPGVAKTARSVSKFI